MRPELKRLILNARTRLGSYTLSSDEAEEDARQQAMEEFKDLLATKIEVSTRLELLFGGKYVWIESRPAVRFQIDGHRFAIAGGKEECDLLEECGDELVPLARLAVPDPSFEDRLLAALGAALQPVPQ